MFLLVDFQIQMFSVRQKDGQELSGIMSKQGMLLKSFIADLILFHLAYAMGASLMVELDLIYTHH